MSNKLVNPPDLDVKPIIICVTGHAGSGKSRTASMLKSLLPNSYCIRPDDYLSDFIVQFSVETEKIIGEPVVTKDGFEYIAQVERKLTAKGWKEWHEIFLSSYANTRLSEDVDSITLECSPYFIIVEHMAASAFDIWKKSNCKIHIQASSLEVLYEQVRKRKGTDWNRKTLEIVHLGVREYIDDIVVDYTINNFYDESFDNEIKILAQQIMKNISILNNFK